MSTGLCHAADVIRDKATDTLNVSQMDKSALQESSSVHTVPVLPTDVLLQLRDRTREVLALEEEDDEKRNRKKDP